MKKFIAIVWVFIIVLFSANAQDVTLSGSGIWVVPCDVTSITVQVYGGGGGAGGGGGGSTGGVNDPCGGGGGGGGGYTTITINVTPGSSFNYVVGAGGTGGGNGGDFSNGSNGNNGSNSTFTGTDALSVAINLIANGGSRGTGGRFNGTNGTGGAGGTASGGTTNTPGAAGTNGNNETGGNGGTGAGPAGGAGGIGVNGGGAPGGAAYGGGGASGGDSNGGAGAAGTILITFVTTTAGPVTPTITSTAATCSTPGSSTISNYVAGTTYTFTPSGPTVGAGGAISGMVPGTNYTVVSGTGACASPPSAPFSNAATSTPPAVPTVSTVPPTCGADGVSTITNYNAAFTYTFTPAGPAAGAGGVISGMVPGTNYTVEAIDGSCTSGQSASFSNTAQLPAPVGAVTGSLTYCTGSNTVLTASGGVSYIWASAFPPAVIGATPSVTVTQGTYAVEVTGANGCKDTVVSTVTELSSIPVTITGSLTYCEGSNTTLTANGAATYIWSDAGNSTTPSINVLAGSYTVTGTDGNGCTGTANANVVENVLPTVTITGTLSYCQGANTTLTANGAASYVWGDGSTTAAVTATVGSYTVTGTDGNGCTALATATVTENPSPAAGISGSLTYCTGGNTTLTANGGTGYVWGDGSTTAAVTVTQGNYSVTVTDANSCTASATATVTESSSLTVNITGATTYCPGANATITANGGATYIWNDGGGSTTPTINVLAGSYTVTASDATGCTGTATANVTELPAPSIAITGTLSYCPGSNTTLTAAGAATYLWSDGSATATITATQGGYTVTGTDGNGCTATATENVTENSAPTVAISGLLTYCTGGNTTLTASGGVGYLWSGGETTASVTVTQGTYSVTATDATGCTGSASEVVSESSTLAVSITGTLTYCPGGTTTITATGGTSYTWNTGATTDAITATGGIYSVTATDASCSGTASATVTETAVAPLTFSDITSCQDSAVVVDAGSGFASYVWSSGETTQTIAPLVSGAYSVTVEDANGCSPSGTVNVTFESCEVALFSMYIPNAFTPNGDGNNEVFQCYAAGVVFADIKIYNRWGEKIFDTNNVNDGWDGTYAGQPCTTGIYVYNINVLSPDGKSNKYKGTVTLIR